MAPPLYHARATHETLINFSHPHAMVTMARRCAAVKSAHKLFISTNTMSVTNTFDRKASHLILLVTKILTLVSFRVTPQGKYIYNVFTYDLINSV